jgi:hypothetical protein
VQAKVAVHPFEQSGIDVGLGCVFARRVHFAAGPGARPRLEHLSGSLDAGVRFCHHRLRQALADPRYILQLAEQPRDVGDLLVDTRPSTRTPGSPLGSTTRRRLSVIEANALKLVDPEIDDLRRHKNAPPVYKFAKSLIIQ